MFAIFWARDRFLDLLQQNTNIPIMAANTTQPPTAPPTIAAMGVAVVEELLAESAGGLVDVPEVAVDVAGGFDEAMAPPVVAAMPLDEANVTDEVDSGG